MDWVLTNDPEYALWAAENLGGKSYDKTVALLQEALADVLRQRAKDRNQKALSVVDAKQLRIAILKPLADALRDGRNRFRDGIAGDMAEFGRLPMGKGQNIVLDILSGQAGRRGSKAYDAEYGRLSDIFDSLSK